MRKLKRGTSNYITKEWREKFICEWEDIKKKLRKHDCSKIKIINKEDE